MVSKVFPYIDESTGDLLVSIRLNNFEAPHVNIEYLLRLTAETLHSLGYRPRT